MKKHIHSFSLLILALSFFYSEANATTQIVTIANFQFAPANFTINLGDTVLFTWISGSHTTTSTTIPGGAASWNQSMNSSSTSFIYVPAVVGVYDYHCAIHTSMIGQFTVTACVPPDYSSSISVNFSSCDSPFVLVATNPVATNYQWIYNGNLITGATNDTYLATNAGGYSTIVSNSCGFDTTPVSILGFISGPIISLAASSDTICSGQSLTLIGSGGITYTWAPTVVVPVSINGDTAVATPTTSFEVIVHGTSFNGCSNTDSLNITVLLIPQAGFSIVQSGDTVTTQNSSIGATIYDWDFGDGFTTNNPAPTHTYATTGVFTIQLIATNAEGCTDTFEMVADLTSGISEATIEQSIYFIVESTNYKINLSSNKKINSSSINFYDISGRILNVKTDQITNNTVSISTQNLSGGIYFVEVISDEKRSTQKVFVQ